MAPVVLRVPRTMTPEAMAELAEVLRTASATAIALAGSGSAFCLGADLKWLGGLDDPGQGVATLVRQHHEVVRAIRAAPIPVVTAVDGAAAGGGMSLALAGDYCVAGPTAKFTAAYFRLGLTPDGGNSSFLPRLLGPARAMELLLSNRTLSASEAVEWGLVNEASAGSAVERACSAAEGFEPVPAETLLTTRSLLDGDLDQRLDEEAAAVSAAAKRPEFRRALEKFLAR